MNTIAIPAPDVLPVHSQVHIINDAMVDEKNSGIIKDKSVDHFQLKTNINCGNCISKISNCLDYDEGISHWDIDTLIPDKILTVQSNGMKQNELIELIRQYGFHAEPMQVESLMS